MATLNFGTIYDLNVSLQTTDWIYYSSVDTRQSGKNHPNPILDTRPIRYGKVTNVDRDTNIVTVDTTCCPGVSPPTENQYIFFSKERSVNMSGMSGYFAETKFINHSTLPVEIFATAVDYVESSK